MAPAPTDAVRTDAALLALFESEPRRAWGLFIHKYSDLIFSSLRRLGFDYDQAMDRFVYVCEKLCDDDFRRFRAVKFLGQSGELTPWLVQVVRNLSINWAQSQEGRRRLFKSIARLSEFDQQVFEAYFRRGLVPAEVCEALRADGYGDAGLNDVLESLERIFARLSPNKLWRLVSQLTRRQGPSSLTFDDHGAAAERAVPCRRQDPEERLLRSEQRRRVRSALDELPARERLLLELRYSDGMALREIADLTQMSVHRAKSALRTARRRLRRGFEALED